jgi:hypothetical protein
MRQAGMCGGCAKSNSSRVLILGRRASFMRNSIARRSPVLPDDNEKRTVTGFSPPRHLHAEYREALEASETQL